MNDPGKYIVVLMTSANELEAQKIARALLEQKKAACVSIFPRGKSFFWWEGKIDRAEEFLLIAKTSSALLSALVKLVKDLHGYEVPEIIALPVAGGNPDYLDWMQKVLSPETFKRESG